MGSQVTSRLLSGPLSPSPIRSSSRGRPRPPPPPRSGTWGVSGTLCTHPRATEAAEPGRRAVIAVVGLHVVVPTVGLLLHLKGPEDQLDAVAILRHDHPVAAGMARVVVVPKLGVGIQLFGLHFSLQPAPALWSRETAAPSPWHRDPWATPTRFPARAFSLQP